LTARNAGCYLGLPVAPKLLAVTGPLKGSAFSLATGDLRIGRDLSNEIPITDSAVSRYHSVVVLLGGTYTVRDLGSMNGTFLNGVPVKERSLEHGDEIGVGLSRFLFLTEDDPVAAKERESPGELRFGATVQLRPEEGLYADPGRLAAALPATDVAQGVEVILRAGREVHGARTLEELGGRLGRLILDALHAQRAAVLFLATGSSEVGRSFGREAPGGEAQVRVSQTIVSQVVKSRAAFLSNDVTASLPSAASLVHSPVRAVIAAPLIAPEGVVGLLYADAADTGIRFGERDLQVLVGLAEGASRAAANLRQMESLAADRRRLEEDNGWRSEMVGESPSMTALHARLEKVAPTDTTVLILGESGTGKELTARAIHRASRRAEGPLVIINCGALTESLLESELFGHEKGAFTGAVARKQGKLELGHKGTVFLDEIGELSPALQTKLLRFLQEREVDRLGGTTPIKVDVRLIAATNRDLAAAVKAGTFRLDLFYRLNVVTLTLPPLRERRDDVRLLASYFLARHTRRANRKVLGITSEAWDCILRHDWPGNVRELENAIERAVVLGMDEWMRPEDLPETLTEHDAPAEAAMDGDGGGGFHAQVNAAKRNAVQNALNACGGVVTEAAKLLGLHPNYLHRLMKNLGMRSAERG
jgi:transcriptional regulator with GAF, ATPase, and Fis domain